MKLGRMNRILAIDEKMGTVTLEPGVRQIDLYRAFRERGLDFMVPTTGAGPECSILGNALERGYGITPHEDHFLSLISLKAVLADGRIYQSALRDLGGERSDDVFKWKIGPFLEGLFTQSNLGVVTQATIALARKPEEVAQFIAFLDDASLEEAVARVSVLKQTLGSVVGGVNLMNRRRMLSMITASSEWSGPDIVPEERVAAQGRRQGISDWMLLGALYGPREMVDAAYRRVRRELRSASRLTLKVTRRRLGWAQGIARWLPATWKIQRTLRTFAKALDVLEGIPSDVALPLAYLKNPQAPVPDELSRRIDECGDRKSVV
jgi:FAD/FMN-containing dehydrogenase